MAVAKTAIAPMKAAQISKPGGDFEIVEREIPTPVEGHVRTIGRWPATVNSW